jgi:hypothetical protein
MFQRYPAGVEHQMQVFHSQLKEREQRHYAAVEALKLGHGGKKYILSLLGMHHKTLKRAIDELLHPEFFAPLPTVGQRRSGGGRKKKQRPTPIGGFDFTP